MRNRTTKSIAATGAVLLAMALGTSIPVLAVGGEVAAEQQAQQHQYQEMQARMQTMHALMTQISETTDPVARQKLMDQQYRLMRDQMNDMGAMQGCMKGQGMPAHGMTGQHTMDGGMMMQPGTRDKSD